MKKIKSFFLLSVMSYLIFSIYQIYMSYKFRLTPKRQNLSFYHDSNMPHSFIPKYIIYRSGSENYNEYLLSLSSDIESISTLDCKLLIKVSNKIKKEYYLNMEERQILRLPGCLYSHISKKIITPATIINSESLLNVSSKLILNVLCDNPSSINKFIVKRLIESHDINLFVKEIGFLSKCKNSYLNKLVSIYIDDIKSNDSYSLDEIIRAMSIDVSDKNINHVKSIYDNNELNLSRIVKKYLLYSVMYKTKNISDKWIIDRIKKLNDIKLFRDSHLFVLMDKSFSHTIEGLIKNINFIKKYDNHAASLLIHVLMHRAEERIKETFNKESKDYVKNQDIYEEMDNYRKEVERDYYTSGPGYKIITLFKELLNDGTSSEINKNLIILVKRHLDSVDFETSSIDMAFSGNSPRSVLFSDVWQYKSDSQVIKKYEEIVEHGYTNTEISWPLKSYSQSDDVYLYNKIHQWKQYISNYPWHPSIDDAYLRLATDLYNTKKFEESISYIEEYFSNKVRPDRSAENTLRALYFHLLISTKPEKLSYDNKILRKLYLLPSCLDNFDCTLISSDQVSYILKNTLLLELAILNGEQLVEVKDLVSKPRADIYTIIDSEISIYNIFHDLSNIYIQPKSYSIAYDSNEVSYICDYDCELSLIPIYNNTDIHYNNSYKKYINRKY